MEAGETSKLGQSHFDRMRVSTPSTVVCCSCCSSSPSVRHDKSNTVKCLNGRGRETKKKRQRQQQSRADTSSTLLGSTAEPFVRFTVAMHSRLPFDFEWNGNSSENLALIHR